MWGHIAKPMHHWSLSFALCHLDLWLQRDLPWRLSWSGALCIIHDWIDCTRGNAEKDELEMKRGKVLIVAWRQAMAEVCRKQWGRSSLLVNGHSIVGFSMACQSQLTLQGKQIYCRGTKPAGHCLFKSWITPIFLRKLTDHGLIKWPAPWISLSKNCWYGICLCYAAGKLRCPIKLWLLCVVRTR